MIIIEKVIRVRDPPYPIDPEGIGKRVCDLAVLLGHPVEIFNQGDRDTNLRALRYDSMDNRPGAEVDHRQDTCVLSGLRIGHPRERDPHTVYAPVPRAQSEIRVSGDGIAAEVHPGEHLGECVDAHPDLLVVPL